RDRAVAVLYADSADLDTDAINLEALETLVRVSGMAVELLVARAAPAAPVAPEEARAEEVATEAQPSYTPTAEYHEATSIAEESVAPVSEVETQPESQWVEPEREYRQPEEQARPESWAE